MIAPNLSRGPLLLARTALRSSALHNSVRSRHLSYVLKPAEALEAFRATPRPAIPLCGAWFLPNDAQKRQGIDVFNARRIPGARFFDLDKVKDLDSPYPHMLPPPEVFAKAMGELGIDTDDTVVVYDTVELGLFSAPRVAWTLRALGHSKVHVLDNFRAWVEEGYPQETGEPAAVAPKSYGTAQPLRPTPAVDFAYVKSIVTGENRFHPDTTVIDARPAGRFEGTDPEPRPGLPSGHMPGAVNIPFSSLLDEDTKQLRPVDELCDVFASRGLDPDATVISTCGTGLSAAIVDVALQHSGYLRESKESKTLIYDGSWTEWAQRVSKKDGLIVNEN